MTTSEASEVKDIVESWIVRRNELFKRPGFRYNDGSNAASLRVFVEIHNVHTRKLMAALRVENADFYDALVELASNASRIVERGRVFVNGQDRTQEGM